MKKITTIMMALMLALTMTQCKKHKENDVNPEGAKVRVSCVVPMNNGGKSEFDNLMTDGSIKWSAGTERLYLAIPDESNPQIVELTAFTTVESNILAFEGEAPEGLLQAGEYDIYYLGNSKDLDVPYITETKEDDVITKVNGSIATQSGSLDDLGYCHIANTTVKAEMEDGEVVLSMNGTLKNQIAIAHLDLNDITNLKGDAIVGTEYALQYNEGTNKFEFAVTESATANITITDGTAASYVVLLPNATANVDLKSNTSKKVTFEGGVEANRIYYKHISDKEYKPLVWEEMEEDDEDSTAPKNLVATATGQTTISLTWDAVQNAISYKVYSNDDVVASDLTETTYTVENLTAGTNYCYYVTAVTEDGESKPSAEACATTKVPSNPDGVFTVNGVTFTMIKVEGNGSDISDYYIGETEVTQELWEAVMGSNPSNFKGPQRPVEKVSWNDCQTFIEKLNQLTGENFTLPPESQWKYAAKGGNKSQGYTYSGSNTVGDVAWYLKNSSDKTHDVKTKSPNELGIYDMSGNVAEWTSSNHGYMYRFYGGAFPHSANNCTVEYWSYNDSDTKARDIGFRLCLSTIINPGQPEEPTIPEAPTNLVATATGQTTISLTWDAVQNATSYNVYSNGNVVVSGFAQTTYIVKNLTPGIQYCYEVKAVNEAGESAASESACATTESEPVTPTVPAAPTNLVATATGQTTVSLTWTAVPNATSYNVYSNENVVASGLTATSYIVENLTAGTQYCYNVTAVNEAGESAASESACATTEMAPIVVETITVNGVSFNMIQVEGGTFTMGSAYDPTDGITDYADETPAHSVTLTTYSIGETEVTQALWKAVMGDDSPASWGEYTENDDYYPQRPAEFISWEDCQEFITNLNQLTGKNFRLPTEAEWEYAARGGNRSKGYMYSGSNDVGEVAWYYGNYVAVDGKTNTHDVKTKKANELGIYDMSGNVLEWCNDWYDDDYYGYSPNENPQGPDQAETSTNHRVCRGGGWGHEAEFCRVAKRFSLEQEKRGSNYGFRLCL